MDQIDNFFPEHAFSSPATPRTIQLFYFEAGGGHRSAALALQKVMAERYPHWRVDLVNLQELLASIDPFPAGIQSQDIYNAMLKRSWTYGSLSLLHTLQKGIRLYTAGIEDLLEGHFKKTQPDLVVSLIPNFNKVMFRALRCVHPLVPYATVMTDIADCPPHFWQEPQDQFLICGSSMAVRQARTAGFKEGQIFEVSGMIMDPRFYQRDGGDRRQERIKLGLDPDLPTALIMFGGNGSKVAAKIVDRLTRSNFKMQSIVMCGMNEKLLKEMQEQEALRIKWQAKKRKLLTKSQKQALGHAIHAIGFTDEVPYYMRLADIFIGKLGPGSISQAVHMDLPVIAELNKKTMPQESPNAEWLLENGFGIVTDSFKRIGKLVPKAFQDGTFEKCRTNTSRHNNFAVYEVPVLFEQFMEKRPVRPRVFSSRPLSQPTWHASDTTEILAP